VTGTTGSWLSLWWDGRWPISNFTGFIVCCSRRATCWSTECPSTFPLTRGPRSPMLLKCMYGKLYRSSTRGRELQKLEIGQVAVTRSMYASRMCSYSVCVCVYPLIGQTDNTNRLADIPTLDWDRSGDPFLGETSRQSTVTHVWDYIKTILQSEVISELSVMLLLEYPQSHRFAPACLTRALTHFTGKEIWRNF
jgi:hypothetical protein